MHRDRSLAEQPSNTGITELFCIRWLRQVTAAARKTTGTGEAGWATRTIREIQLTQPASASPSLTSDKLPIEQVNSPDITN
jgi:hypothetical protein